MKNKILSVVCLVLLTGCSLKPLDVKEQKTYLLVPGIFVPLSKHTSPKTLLVTVPAADPGYQTAAMAYMRTPYQLQYYTQNRWVDAPAQLILPWVVEALRKTHGFSQVVSPPYTSHLNLRLDLRLVELFQDFTLRPSVVHFKLHAQLIDMNTQQILGSHDCVVTKPAPSENPRGAVGGANRALSLCLSELSDFVVKVGS